jgi:hypothetical protein
MKAYRTKISKLSGTDFHEVHRKARDYYKQIKKKSKRRPYIRSAYFDKNKIFLELFWQHLFDKENWQDRLRRLKYFTCAIELIKNCNFEPMSRENPNKRSEILHRFIGIARDNEVFFVQIKEDKQTGNKYLISVFSLDKRKKTFR